MEKNIVNLKDYRDKELRYYLIANIAVLLLLLDFFHMSQSVSNIQISDLISTFFNASILSSTIYVLSFVADSLFSSRIKDLLIFGHLPGEKIFSKIKDTTIDNRFSSEDALKKYSQVYESMPKTKKDKYTYENVEWYKIYNKHREVTMIMLSNRDFLLCRDIYFSTIIIIIIYLFLSIIFKIIIFDLRYLCYLFVMLIISNIGTRNRAMRFVCNVITYDITNNTTNNAKENNYG